MAASSMGADDRRAGRLSAPVEGGRPGGRHDARVADVMHPGIVFCIPRASLRTVAQIMAGRQIHAVVVSDLDMPVWKHRWGVITDIDLARAFASDVHRTTAAEIARAEPRTVRADDSLDAAAEIMGDRDDPHLVVVEGEPPRAVGILSALDLARAMAESRE